LTNVLYAGQVRHRGQLYPGAQPALVQPATWQKVQALLTGPGQRGARLPGQAPLAGLLFCQPCGCAMTPAHASKRGRRYRYYVCTHAQKYGWQTCPSRSVPAHAIERFVWEQVREHGGTAVPAQEAAAATLPESQRLLQRLVEQVHYDGAQHKVVVTLRCAESRNGNPEEMGR